MAKKLEMKKEESKISSFELNTALKKMKENEAGHDRHLIEIDRMKNLKLDSDKNNSLLQIANLKGKHAINELTKSLEMKKNEVKLVQRKSNVESKLHQRNIIQIKKITL